ncbi:MAG: CsgG/HfaB family protein, partial [Prevotellaceae bacterium]|nr:CsgG/HfaB family protein [Prevotellaceae bacterium]
RYKIAVVDFQAGAGITQVDVDGMCAMLVTYMKNPKWILVEREQLNEVIKEQGFQRTFLTQREMVKIGQILNLTSLVVGDVTYIRGEYNIDVRIVSAETGRVYATAGRTWSTGTTLRSNMQALAAELAAQVKSPKAPVPKFEY